MYKQVINTGNDSFRDTWVRVALKNLKSKSQLSSLLDVGAGLSPYKDSTLDLGFEYTSHDFGGYVPSAHRKASGLHSASWEYPKHDYICDILALPADALADVIICTEVLEHVPDPIRVFEKLSKMINSGGYLVFTVPFSSLMHQAPYWFQAGLSPFWFEYWAKEFNVEVVELTVYGDYVDQMLQEMTRLFPFLRHIPGATKVIAWLAKKYRGLLSEEVLTSGGYGVLFVGKRI
jgi:2-polyprenyl-3-methyl-5-hydroxy-6-metoxy-1,4-benzoquinol methylase